MNAGKSTRREEHDVEDVEGEGSSCCNMLGGFASRTRGEQVGCPHTPLAHGCLAAIIGRNSTTGRKKTDLLWEREGKTG